MKMLEYETANPGQDLDKDELKEIEQAEMDAERDLESGKLGSRGQEGNGRRDNLIRFSEEGEGAPGPGTAGSSTAPLQTR